MTIDLTPLIEVIEGATTTSEMDIYGLVAACFSAIASILSCGAALLMVKYTREQKRLGIRNE
ncbi:hypothetical protein L4C37_22180 [Vibrio kagoshimensis]|uniref:hypothetical protein n=1 Tax=Vibrio kagoshimensis TaxID=2910244 RepID=UPI003D192077